MKDIKTITKTVIVEGVAFVLFQFTAENEQEKYFGEKPFGLIEKSLLKTNRTFNGFDMHISSTPNDCFNLARTHILACKFRETNPTASDEELIRYLLAVVQ